MTDSALHLTLRELRTDFSKPKGLAALAGVGVLLGLSGPFQTYDILTVGPRIAYWIALTYLTYAVGAFINIYLNIRFEAFFQSLGTRVVVVGIATGIGVMAVVSLMNTLLFGWPYNTAGEAVAAFIVVTIISTIITALLILLSPSDAGEAQAARPAILDRLPIEKRGALVAVSSEDHYVRVTTTKGQEMLLMRLSDAIKETMPASGLQVHRSHWVAIDQVSKADRLGDRARLTMRDGSEIPVSRSSLPALRDAGLLPRSGRG